MAIDKYKESFFSKLFTLFDTESIGWAENIYNKIKVDGILPKYISREKGVSKINLTEFTNSSITEDSRFTWGYKKKPTTTYSYQLLSYADIGTVHDIEFEIESNSLAAGYVIAGSSEIVISTSGNTTLIYRPIFSGVGVSFTFALNTDYHTIRISRNNDSVSLYLDNQLVSNQTLPIGENLSFQFNRLSGGNFSTGQIKMTNGDKILHWWKGVSALDEGVNGVDFYTLWHTICHIFSILYRYSSYLTRINTTPELIKRFLNSKGINFSNNSSDSELSGIYSRWQTEFENRGAGIIAKSETSRGGVCLLPRSSDYGFTGGINLGNNYTIEFDWKYDISISNTTTAGYIFTWINSTSNGSSQPLIGVDNFNTNNVRLNIYGGVNNISGNPNQGLVELIIPKENILHKIKIVRSGHNYWVYLDGILSGSGNELSLLNDDVTGINPIIGKNNAVKGCIGKLANLKAYGIYDVIFGNEFDKSFFTKTDFNKPSYSIFSRRDIDGFFINPRGTYYYGNVDAPSLSELFTIDDDFDNVLQEDKGELLRLIDKQDSDEFILAYNSSIGWTLNTSSPSQNQTYPIAGFNRIKEFNETGDLSILPISYGGLTGDDLLTISIKEQDKQINNNLLEPPYSVIYKRYWCIDIRPTVTGTPKKYGISSTAYMQYNLNDYLIPISDNEDYEISFRITTGNPNINIKFRPICYDAIGNELTPISAKDGSITDISFIDVPYGNAGMASFIEKIIFTRLNSTWIRGILHKKNTLVGEDMNGLNQNLSFTRNLIMAEGTTFIIPEILIEGDTATLTQIYDIQVRPAKSNVDKGQLNTKNLFSIFCMNRSNTSISNVESVIDTSLIPVDSFVKIKELNIDNPFIDLNNYGFLYNGYAIITGNLAPTGWHIPTIDEWVVLENGIGGSSVAGGKLKELGTDNWDTPNTGATDEYGFTALPGGFRFSSGGFFYKGSRFKVFSSTIIPGYEDLYSYSMYYNNKEMNMVVGEMKSGLSIRCIKDTSDWVEGETVTDFDGNVYKTVKIGTQVWMATNLRTKHYNNGTLIPEVIPNIDWAALTTGAWCTYNNEPLNKDLLAWDNSTPISWDNREVIEYQ